MNEAQLLDLTMAHAGNLGLLTHHCRDARHCSGCRGLPDVIALGPRGLLLAELKGPAGETSAAQDRWLYTAHLAGIQYGIYNPDDWHNGRLKTALRAIAA